MTNDNDLPSRGGSKSCRSGSRQQQAPAAATATAADWELEDVVKSKVTSKCFWNACKALSFGLFLMFIGTTMAILGYFADQLSVVQELRGNTTVRIKHEARGFHLNNLSYAGPIVMGVGGFIVVAACVMTFEARDSAAKIVPTPRARHPGSYHAQRSKSSRFHQHGGGSSVRSSMMAAEYAACSSGSRRSTSSQTAAGNNGCGGGVIVAPGRISPIASELLNRRELTQAFVQFSRDLGPSALIKSPSAPDLTAGQPSNGGALGGGGGQVGCTPHGVSSVRTAPIRSQALLSPHYLLQRQALSVDNPEYGCALVGRCFSPPGVSRNSIDKAGGQNGSQTSMAMDLHLENPITIRVRDRGAAFSRVRGGSTRRHLVRQRPVEVYDDSETHSWSPRYRRYDEEPRPCRSGLPSRRDSMVRTTSRGSGDVHINTAMQQQPQQQRESVKRRRSRTMRRKSQSSRSASDRSTERASPDHSAAGGSGQQLKPSTDQVDPPSDNSAATNDHVPPPSPPLPTE